MQLHYERQNWSVCPGQDGAICGDYLFRFNTSGGCTAYSIAEQKEIGTFQLPKTDLLLPHSNSVCFGAERAAQEDEFPLLYTNVYNSYEKESDCKEGVCLVYRLQRSGTAFSAELVQVIQIGFVEELDYWKSVATGESRPFGNFTVDKENRKIYAFTMRDREHITRYFRFTLPALADGKWNDIYGCKVVTLGIGDIESQFDCPYSNFLQGTCFHGGMLYSTEGFGSAAHPALMQIIDPTQKTPAGVIDLQGLGFGEEPEFVDFCGDILYYIDAHGDIVTFRFQ